MNRKIRLKLPTFHSSGRGVGVYAEKLAAALAATDQVDLVNSDPELVHFPYFDLFYPTLSLLKTTPTVVTIHDLTPLVLSDRYPKGIRGTFSLMYQRLSLSEVKAVITDSQCSQKDIRRYFGLPESRIFVTPLGVGPEYFISPSPAEIARLKKRYQLPDKFVLTVAGGPNPNKNLPRLAAVTARLNIPLVIIGRDVAKVLPPGKPHPELMDLLELNRYFHLIRPGFISTSELIAFYHLATVYCQPSLYEGFGLPLLEAMAAGTPVVSSNTSSLPEIYPPGTPDFDPQDDKSMEAALKKALSQNKNQTPALSARLKKHASAFTWEKTASLTLSVYRHVLGL